jgi:serine kinase of HPr protein (carbohydrate metabolism regulator)
MILHAGLIARRVDGLWLGALLEGPSGAGKSDLALRAVGQGFRLVADDRVVAFVSAHRLYGRAPDSLAGLMEIRGVGVLGRERLAFARIVLRIACAPDRAAVDRIPEPSVAPILGVAAPSFTLWPFEVSAPAKITAMLELLGAQAQERYQARLRATRRAAERVPGVEGSAV